MNEVVSREVWLEARRAQHLPCSSRTLGMKGQGGTGRSQAQQMATRNTHSTRGSWARTWVRSPKSKCHHSVVMG